MKITINNYFENSKGEWKFLSQLSRDQIIDSGYVRGRKYCKPYSNHHYLDLISQIVKIPKNELIFNFKSYNSFWKNGSFYVFHKKSNTLFRISDHWSDCNHPEVYTCGSIRSCFWSLKVLKKDWKNIKQKPTNRHQYNNYWLAKIKVSKLEENE